MPYKTVAIKLRKPTDRKRRMLDQAGERYSQALALLLEEWERREREGEAPVKADRELLRLADRFDAQPFKDALKMDLSTLLAQRRVGGPVPLTRTEDAQVYACLEGPLRPKRLHAVLDKWEQVRPPLFCRHDKSRDYSLLRDRESGRYYVKLYLFNRSGALERTPGGPRPLEYLWPEGEPFAEQADKVRYLLLPLEEGPWQRRHLEEIARGEASPKSALLVKREGEYFLHVRLWYPNRETVEPERYLGVARGIRQALCYVLCDLQGNLLQSGALEEQGGGKNALHLLANQVVELAGTHKAQVILEKLGDAGDDLSFGGRGGLLSQGSYNQAADMILYKAQLAGIPQPVRVSARRIYQRCPLCGVTRKANRYNREMLLCVSCGTYQPVTSAAAQNLATALIRYRDSKLRVDYQRKEDRWVFRLKALDLEFSCPPGPFAFQAFCDHVEEFVKHPGRPLTRKQVSIVKKLSAGGELLECFTFEEQH